MKIKFLTQQKDFFKLYDAQYVGWSIFWRTKRALSKLYQIVLGPHFQKFSTVSICKLVFNLV